MKKLILYLFLLINTLSSFAQKDVTKFMGIPVDGTKSEMIQRLKAKGFTYDAKTDCLGGEFNGDNVLISVKTVNGKVWRVAVVTPDGTRTLSGYDETQVKIKFNRLCQQFEQNPKYVSLLGTESQEIGDEEDISYEMSVKSKQYEAGYLQDGDEMKLVWFTFFNYYSGYFICIFYDNLYNAANGEDL